MFHDIKRILPGSIQRSGVSRQVEAVNVLKIFNKVAREVLSEEVIKQIEPMHIKNNILTIACLSSLVMQELQYKEGEIVEKINKEAGKEVVRKLNYAT